MRGDLTSDSERRLKVERSNQKRRLVVSVQAALWILLLLTYFLIQSNQMLAPASMMEALIAGLAVFGMGPYVTLLYMVYVPQERLRSIRFEDGSYPRLKICPECGAPHLLQEVCPLCSAKRFRPLMTVLGVIAPWGAPLLYIASKMPSWSILSLEGSWLITSLILVCLLGPLASLMIFWAACQPWRKQEW